MTYPNKLHPESLTNVCATMMETYEYLVYFFVVCPPGIENTPHFRVAGTGAPEVFRPQG